MTTHTYRKLYRSQEDRILAGVCGGIAEYFDIDPVLVRIAFVLLTFGGGAGIIGYIILALIIPTRTGETKAGEFAQEAAEKAKDFFEHAGEKKENHSRRNNGRNFVGVVIIIVGLLALLGQLLPFSWFRWHLVWPVALVILGFWIIRGSE